MLLTLRPQFENHWFTSSLFSRFISRSSTVSWLLTYFSPFLKFSNSWFHKEMLEICKIIRFRNKCPEMHTIPTNTFTPAWCLKKKSVHILGILNSFQTDKEVNAYNLHYLCHLSVDVNIHKLRVKTFVWWRYISRFIMRNRIYKQTIFRPYVTIEFDLRSTEPVQETNLSSTLTSPGSQPAICQSGCGNYTTISSNQSRKPNLCNSWPQIVRTRLLTDSLSTFCPFCQLGTNQRKLNIHL